MRGKQSKQKQQHQRTKHNRTIIKRNEQHEYAIHMYMYARSLSLFDVRAFKCMSVKRNERTDEMNAAAAAADSLDLCVKSGRMLGICFTRTRLNFSSIAFFGPACNTF